MPETYRYTISMQHDSLLPRDAIVHSLHFRHSLGALLATDHESMASNIAQAFETNWVGISTGLKRIEVKAYRTEGPPPHDPLVTHVRNPAGAALTVNYPAEIALCLSFKGGQRPWERGRIYLAPYANESYRLATSLARTPPQGIMDAALALGQGFADAGGPDWSWVVHSKAHAVDTPVASCWVDNEWDTQRRRGLRASARSTKTTGS